MHQQRTKQLGYLALGVIMAFAITVGFTSLAHADTATTTGTTTTSYVFDADLSGANQVPPVAATTSTWTSSTGTTTATTTGHARVWFDMTSASGTPTTTTMMWKSLDVWNGDNITAAHLHCGLPGQSGPIVLDLVHIASSTNVNGTLVATSTVNQSDLHATSTGCSMPILNMTDLANAMKAGLIYANVHSVAYPSGVVRGQMMLTSQVSTSTSGNGHTCTNSTNNTGWFDNAGIWHSCGTGGTNGDGTCMTPHCQGWFDSNGNWHWCLPTGGNGGGSGGGSNGGGNGGGNNGGGTTTPGQGFGASIVSFIHSLFQGAMTPTQIQNNVFDFVRGIRTIR